jgi:hypothetical protein
MGLVSVMKVLIFAIGLLWAKFLWDLVVIAAFGPGYHDGSGRIPTRVMLADYNRRLGYCTLRASLTFVILLTTLIIWVK